MLFYIYSDSTASTIDITSRCRVGRFSVKDQAEEGAVAMSSLIVDDPDGDIEFTGHRRIYIYESDAPILDQVVFNGFIVNERVERGPYRTGAGRQWVLDLADNNVLINRRIMNGVDASRPAETDLARIQALLTMTELNTVDDDTYVSLTAGTTAMDAADYRGQNVGAYIDDCRQATGKNGYILYNETLGQYGLWYDFADSVVYDSGCFLSNTIGDGNGTTVFEYSQERTHLNRDPSRVASGIYLDYSGGTVYVQDAGTIDTFAAIDWAAPSVNVKTLAKATARAERYLADASSEHEIIHTVLTKVPRASVNKIKKGQLVSFKASWMTGYESYRVCRVLYRTVTEIGEDPQNSFEIEMDLDPSLVPVPVQAQLYEAGSTATSGVSPDEQLYWFSDGDSPPSGQPTFATVPVGWVTLVIDPSPPVGVPGDIISWEVHGDSVPGAPLTIIGYLTCATVGPPGEQHSLRLYKNGVLFYDNTFTIPEPKEWNINTTVDVVDGDIINAKYYGYAQVPSGTGGGEYMRITGSLVLP